MSFPSPTPPEVAFLAALRAAAQLGRGVSAELEPLTRAFAHDQHEAGIRVEEMLTRVKALVRETTGRDEPLFMPKVVGWAVAGYFAGHRRAPGEPG